MFGFCKETSLKITLNIKSFLKGFLITFKVALFKSKELHSKKSLFSYMIHPTLPLPHTVLTSLR